MRRIGLLLITAALLAATAGCPGGHIPPPSQNLEIRTWYDLDEVRDNLEGNHTLMNDLDSTTPGYEELAGPTANGGEGWHPIGTVYQYGTTYYWGFRGTFCGQGYEICDLFINRPNEESLGLFGDLHWGAIKDVGVVNVTVIGEASCVGGLVGINGWGNVSNSYSTGSVTGNESVGGLVGMNEGAVNNSYSTASVTGEDKVGGLVGLNGLEGPGTVSDSYATGSVTGKSYVGGLVGVNFRSALSNSYSTGSVSGNYDVGGLVGISDGAVNNSYSTGNVTGSSEVGGLAGFISFSSVNNSYSTGSVSGQDAVGGLAGRISWGTVSNCYATGSVGGTSDVGGLAGLADTSNVTSSFWDIETSGQATSAGGTGRNTTEMHDIITFSGAVWNITAVANPGSRNPSYIWNMVDDVTYPFLSWEST